jgi:hypothetical protein
MKLFKQAISILLLAISIGQVHSQFTEYSKLMNFNPRNMGVIMSQNVVSGYYVFYDLEDVEDNTKKFKVQLLGVDLNIVSEFKVKRSKKTELIEVAYSDKTLLLLFFDGKGTEYASYDFDGNELGSKQIAELDFGEKMRLKSLKDQNLQNNSVIQNIGSKGFLRNSVIGTKKPGFELEALNPNLTSKWTYRTKEKLETDEFLDLLFVSEKYVAFAHNKRQNTTIENDDSEFLLLNSENGNQIFKVSSRLANGKQMTFESCYIDETENQIYITGEYFSEKINTAKEPSEGLYIRKMSINGQETEYREYGWLTEIGMAKSKALSTTALIDYEDTDRIWIHDILFSNGRIYAICEQYERHVNAAAIGAIVVTRIAYPSVFDIKITNLISIEFDEKMNIANMEIIQKKKRIAESSSDNTAKSSKSTARQVLLEGKFDYRFSLRDPQKNSFEIIYTDRNRKLNNENKEKADRMLGVIEINGEQKKTYKKPILTDATYFWLLPAKPGYILLGEYFSAGRRVILKLEKLNPDN